MNETARTPAGSPQRSRLAVWSLVCGILAIVLSVVCIGPLFAIPAVICGHIGYSRIRRSAGALSGEGLAVGGLITGYLGIALIPVVGLLAAIAVPNFVKARSTAQMNMCINNLGKIDKAKQQWAVQNNKADTDIPAEHELSSYLKRSDMTCPAGGDYTINAVGEQPTCSLPNHELPER
jgi:competence protein ComGC